jgi:hypothetical protein
MAPLTRQGIAAGELTAFYVVQLLTGFMQRPIADDAEPLAVKLARALDSGGSEQRPVSRKSVMSHCSFPGFADSIRRKLVDVDYYVSIGGCA